MATGAGEWTRFSASLNRLSADLRASDIAGVSGAALVMKRAIEAEAVAQGAGKLGRVGYDVKGSANPTAVLQAKSRKAHLLERGTKAHEIKADPAKRRQQIGRALQALFGQSRGSVRVRRTSARVRAGALSWQGGSHPVGVVQHRGARAKPFFWPGVEHGLPLAADAYAAAVDKHVTSAFR